MSRLDDLPPDQRAVLLLLVQQGKSHAEIADMLGIPQSAVRDRAFAPLEALTEDVSSVPVVVMKHTTERSSDCSQPRAEGVR